MPSWSLIPGRSRTEVPRRYTNLSCKEVYQALLANGYAQEDLPSEHTLRDSLSRMNHRLKRVVKARQLKKTKDTDAIFANGAAVEQEVQDAPATLEISVDNKAKVNEGAYSQGEKSRTDSAGAVPRVWIMTRHRSASGRRWASWCWPQLP